MDEWEGATDRRMNRRNGGTRVVREGEEEATSHYVSAVHQGNWSVCDSYRQDGEGRGG